MTVEHRWLPDETPWPEQARLVYGEMVELTTPHPPIPELGRLGPEIVGSRGVIVTCVIEQDERDGRVGPLYTVETEDGSPWRLRPEFLVSRGAELRIHSSRETAPYKNRSDGMYGAGGRMPRTQT
ncbi:hypothetical protein [Streptomyces aculeolatus]|uniref:hypothetical protein n=1 Tax=Streptomyces aculeolatus TaxID=270689 RepID=UPI001CEC3889|nr:hypothetical protein [Streptomyces aculeolatus]